jgi:Fe-S oxidoreductase
MATYKAEFNYHHYARRLRPRTAYSMGFIYWWLELASRAPKVANFLCHAPVVSSAAKHAAGIARARRLPHFAAQTFKEWFAVRGNGGAARGARDARDARDARGDGGALGDGNEGRNRPDYLDRPKVLLWPDTFNNHLHPEILGAAVEVLEAGGWRVEVPTRSLCCGRPLYAWGMLDLAKRQLRAAMQALEHDALAGVPIVGVEPACVSTFRDELPKLFPNDERAKRLAQQTFMLGEFLGQQQDYSPPRLERRALVHRHCHHHAMIGFEGDAKIMEKMGLDAEILDSGCCGMAGPFGFEANHYELSLKIGERVLLPAVRRAKNDTLILTDGYACREQIAQSTNRNALHLAQVLAMALRGQDEHSGASRPQH